MKIIQCAMLMIRSTVYFFC